MEEVVVTFHFELEDCSVFWQSGNRVKCQLPVFL